MFFSITTWVVLAVLLFWGIGAYNRMMRLRSQAVAAFAALDASLLKHAELVQEHLSVSNEVNAWNGLCGAANQFLASLAAMRTQPLNRDAAAAMKAAQEVFVMAWQRLQSEEGALPPALHTQWQNLSAWTQGTREQFNAAVASYNEAISQFPALLLSWLFGFRAAREL